MRIVVADDSLLLREGLQLLLAEAGHEVVAAVGDGPAYVAAVAGAPPRRRRGRRPDAAQRTPTRGCGPPSRCAGPGRRRGSWCSRSTSRCPTPTSCSPPGDGGVGYLLKDRVSDLDDFLAALATVADGGTVLDPQVVAQLMTRRRDPLEGLTPREREVLGLMAEGRSNAAIAEALVVTEGAVEKHTQRIFAKLGLLPDDAQHRRVLAVVRFLQAG